MKHDLTVWRFSRRSVFCLWQKLWQNRLLVTEWRVECPVSGERGAAGVHQEGTTVHHGGTTGGVPSLQSQHPTHRGQVSGFLLKLTLTSSTLETCETVIGPSHVRTGSQSVDMDLDTKPDDYSLEIGDGGGVRVSQ